MAFKGKWQAMAIKSYVEKDKEFNNLQRKSSSLSTYLIFHTWKKLKFFGSADEDTCFGTAIINRQFCLNTRPIWCSEEPREKESGFNNNQANVMQKATEIPLWCPKYDDKPKSLKFTSATK